MLSATFELTDTSEVATAWFIGSPDMDWLALVYRDSPTDRWRARYRFRWIHDDKNPFDSKDLKSGYTTLQAKPEVSSEQARTDLIRMMDLAAGFIAQRRPSRVWREDINGTGDDLLKVWSRQPFVHTRVVPAPPTEWQ